jgi:ribosomal 30S subunit maturation factor RimM
MQVSDLVAIGKLGKSIDSNGFAPFKDHRNFHLSFLRDVFLLFTDNRVRYVTVTEIDSKTSIKIKIDDEEILKEAVRDGNVNVMLPHSDIDDLMHDQEEEDFIGMKAFFQDRLLGKVIESFFNGAQEVITIEDENGKEILIPMVDAYVIDIDDANIILKNIEDFLEL